MILIKSKTGPSKIHGVGLFAEEFIPKGKKVWEYTPWFDFALTQKQVDELSEAARIQFLNYAYKSKETGKYVLCSDDARFFNHHDAANVYCIIPENASFEDDLVCFAAKDIEVGEELTANYSEFDLDPSDVI